MHIIHEREPSLGIDNMLGAKERFKVVNCLHAKKWNSEIFQVGDNSTLKQRSAVMPAPNQIIP